MIIMLRYRDASSFYQSQDGKVSFETSFKDATFNLADETTWNNKKEATASKLCGEEICKEISGVGLLCLGFLSDIQHFLNIGMITW